MSDIFGPPVNTLPWVIEMGKHDGFNITWRTKKFETAWKFAWQQASPDRKIRVYKDRRR